MTVVPNFRSTFMVRGRRVGVVVVLLLHLGCGDQIATPRMEKPTQLPWSILLNHRAVTLSTVAPYDTIKLTGALLNPFGSDLAAFPAVTFHTIDKEIEVTIDGTLTAKSAVSEARVIASATYANVTITDTVLVRVTTAISPQPLGSLVFTRVDGDTVQAKNGGGGWGEPTLPGSPIRAIDQVGNLISSPLVIYWTSDGNVVQVLNRKLSNLVAMNRGLVQLYVEGTVYGVKKRDSIPVLVRDSYFTTVNIKKRTPVGSVLSEAYFEPSEQVIGAGGVILWVNTFKDLPTDITFTDSSAVSPLTKVPGAFVFGGYGIVAGEGGNIAEFVKTTGVAGGRGRRFYTPGVYHYRSVRYGTTGRIVVR